MGVLGDTHAPEDHRPLGGGIEPRHLANGIGLDPTQAAHRFGRHVYGVGLQRFEPFGMFSDVSRIVEFFGDDHIEHGVKQRHVGPRRKSHAQMSIGVQRLPAGSRIRILVPRLAACLKKVAATG